MGTDTPFVQAAIREILRQTEFFKSPNFLNAIIMRCQNGALNCESSHKLPTEISKRKEERSTVKDGPTSDAVENEDDIGEQNQNELRQAESDYVGDEFVMDRILTHIRDCDKTHKYSLAGKISTAFGGMVIRRTMTRGNPSVTYGGERCYHTSNEKNVPRRWISVKRLTASSHTHASKVGNAMKRSNTEQKRSKQF